MKFIKFDVNQLRTNDQFTLCFAPLIQDMLCHRSDQSRLSLLSVTHKSYLDMKSPTINMYTCTLFSKYYFVKSLIFNYLFWPCNEFHFSTRQVVLHLFTCSGFPFASLHVVVPHEICWTWTVVEYYSIGAGDINMATIAGLVVTIFHPSAVVNAPLYKQHQCT